MFPEWRSPDEYPDPDATSLRQWAWEFLRRNKIYQEDYGLLAEMGALEMDKSKTPETLLLFFDVLTKYSLWVWSGRLPDPNIADINIVAPNMLFESERLRMLVPENSWPGVPDAVLSEGWDPTSADPEDVVVVFDISKPIPPKLRTAKLMLAAYSDHIPAERLKLKKQVRPRTDKYPECLRLLDAVDTGIPMREIAETLYPYQALWYAKIHAAFVTSSYS